MIFSIFCKMLQMYKKRNKAETLYVEAHNLYVKLLIESVSIKTIYITQVHT